MASIDRLVVFTHSGNEPSSIICFCGFFTFVDHKGTRLMDRGNSTRHSDDNLQTERSGLVAFIAEGEAVYGSVSLRQKVPDRKEKNITGLRFKSFSVT